MEKREKKQYPADFKTSFGFSTMLWPVAASTTLITSFFMLYLTDYSGIDAAVGKLGFAASFGTILLLIARIVDIVDDPLQAFIIDNAKESRLGKYRKFAFANIILVTVAIICVFSIPELVKSNAVLLCIWVGFFYLMYELGVAFNTSIPLIQKMSYDTKLRTKWTTLMRIWLIVILVPVYFYIPVVTAANKFIGNIGRSFSLVCAAMMAVLGIISFIGVKGMRERPGTSLSSAGEADEKLKIGEVLRMFAKNKPLLVHTGAMFLYNLVFSLQSVVSIYFLKWFYSADLATGIVNNDFYAEIYGLYAISGLLPNFIAPFIANKLMNKTKTYVRASNICILIAIVIYSLMSAAYFTGILRTSPFIFIVLNFLSGMAMGTAVIPQTLLWTQGADYAEYKTGKTMSAMVNSVSNIMGKAQAALSSVLTGVLLTAVGYSVNSETGNYAGDVAGLPGMVNGFGLFMTIIPVIVMILSYLMYRFLYPITPEIQKQMADSLAARHTGETPEPTAKPVE